MRVSIRLDDIGFDATVPGDVPAAELLPALWDIGIAHGADEGTAALSRHLYVPGAGPVDPSASLTEAGVTDGELLVLTTAPAAPIEIVDADPARALARHTRDGDRWSPRRSRIAALAAAACAAATVGYTAIPDAPVPRLLLAAAAVATVAVPAARWMPGVADVFAPVAVAAGLVVATTLPAMMFDVDIAMTGLALAAVALVVLAAAGRAVLTLGGSEPGRWAGRHARVVAGAAAAAGIGAVLAGDVVFSAVVAVVLLSRAGHPLPPTARAVLLTTGTLGACAALVTQAPAGAAWPAAVGLSAAACALGWTVAGPTARLLPILAAAERIALVAVLPAAWWALDLR